MYANPERELCGVIGWTEKWCSRSSRTCVCFVRPAYGAAKPERQHVRHAMHAVLTGLTSTALVWQCDTIPTMYAYMEPNNSDTYACMYVEGRYNFYQSRLSPRHCKREKKCKVHCSRGFPLFHSDSPLSTTRVHDAF